MNLNVKVLDFVQSGGTDKTELRTFQWEVPSISSLQPRCSGHGSGITGQTVRASQLKTGGF